MTTAAVLCSQCNTPLSVAATTFSVSCTSCGQWHLIDRSGLAPVATPFGDPAETGKDSAAPSASETAVETPADGINAVQERLDQEWQWERKRYLVLSWNGDDVVPDVPISLGVGLVVSAFGVALLLYAGGSSLSDRLPGLLLVGAGIGIAAYRLRKAQAYQQAYLKYQRRRRASSKPVDPCPPEDCS